LIDFFIHRITYNICKNEKLIFLKNLSRFVQLANKRWNMVNKSKCGVTSLYRFYKTDCHPTH